MADMHSVEHAQGVHLGKMFGTLIAADQASMHSTTPQDSQYDSGLDEKPQFRADRVGYGRERPVGTNQGNIGQILWYIHDATFIALEGRSMADRICFALGEPE